MKQKMKNIMTMIWILFGLLLFASCTNETDSAALAEEEATRWDVAVSRSVTNGEDILVIGKQGGEEELRGVLVPSETEGGTAQWKGQRPSWKGEERLDMYVVSPVPSDNELPTEVDAEAQTGWMCGYVASAYKPGSFELHHLMARLQVHILFDEALDGVTIEELQLALHTKAEIDYVLHRLHTPKGRDFDKFNVHHNSFTQEGYYWVTRVWYVVPQTIERGKVCLVLRLSDGREFTFAPETDLEVLAGKVNHLHLRLNNAQPYLILQGGNISITDWQNTDIAADAEEELPAEE